MGVAILELPEPAARAFGKLRRVRRSLHTSRAVGGARRAHPNSGGDGWPLVGVLYNVCLVFNMNMIRALKGGIV